MTFALGVTTCGGENADRTDAEWWVMLTECKSHWTGRDRFIQEIRDTWKDITRKELKAYVKLLFKTYSSDKNYSDPLSSIMLAYWKVTHDKNPRRKGKRGRKPDGPGKPGSEYVIVENLGVHREAVLLIRS